MCPLGACEQRANFRETLRRLTEGKMSTAVDPNHPLSSTLQNDPAAKAVLAELNRILASRFFKDAARCRQFLEYVVRYKLERHTEPIKERTIGTEVFNRPLGYQTAEDSVVRGQATEVRKRLELFYQSEGKNAAVQIELPLGSYSPNFRIPEKLEAVTPAGVEHLPIQHEPHIQTGSGKRWPTSAMVAVLLLIAMGCAFLVRNFLINRPTGTELSSQGADTQLKAFWGMPSSRSGIVVAFLSLKYLASSSGELVPYTGSAVADRGAIFESPHSPDLHGRNASIGRDEAFFFESSIMGTGQAFAIYDLTRMLDGMGIKMSLCRRQSMQASELQDHDVVFLGSTGWNGLLEKINLPKRFIFHTGQTVGPWGGAIEDTSATSSATRFYKMLRDPKTQAIQSDYSVFKVAPSPSAGHRIVLLGGISTTGTQGAAAFATSADGIAQVRQAFGLANRPNDPLPESFECLLRVEAAGGLDALQVTPVSCSKD